MLGKATINDGKIEGETISFSINANFQGNEMKLEYKGKVVGDQIKPHRRIRRQCANGGIYTLKRI